MLMLELLFAPALIGLATWIARRYGPVVGGWCAALPLTSGPVVLVLAIDRGTEFAAHASRGVLLGLTALAAFAVAYAWCARTWHWAASSVAGAAAYLACAWLLRAATISLVPAFLIACGVLLVAIALMPRDRARHGRVRAGTWDLPMRMILAAALVLLITTTAGSLGPQTSGLLTPFPIAATLLAAFTQHLEGPSAASALLRGLLIGLFSFALFFLTVGATIIHLGILAAFSSATLAALLSHIVAWRWTMAAR